MRRTPKHERRRIQEEKNPSFMGQALVRNIPLKGDGMRHM